MQDSYTIKNSQVHGRGLFARKLITKGERILQFTGARLSLIEVLNKLSHEPNPERHGDALQVDFEKYIDIQEPGVIANHSCLPNAGVKNNRFLIAIDDILPDQEITYDYSTTMEEDRWTMVCKCGNANCRKIIGDFRWLPVDVQNRYLNLGVVQSFIVETSAKDAILQRSGTQPSLAMPASAGDSQSSLQTSTSSV